MIDRKIIKLTIRSFLYILEKDFTRISLKTFLGTFFRQVVKRFTIQLHKNINLWDKIYIVIVKTPKPFIWSDQKKCVTISKPKFIWTISAYARTLLLLWDIGFLFVLTNHFRTFKFVLIPITCYESCHKQLISNEKIPPD